MVKKQQPVGRAAKSRKGRELRDRDEAVRPIRIEPGVVGRTRWFTERTGYKADSSSLRRLRAGLDVVERMNERGVVEPHLRDRALEFLAKARLPADQINAPLLVTGNGKPRELRIRRAEKIEGLSALTPPIEIPETKDKSAFIVIPVPAEVAEYLDLSEVIGADVQIRRAPRLLGPFEFLPNEGILVGQVPGERALIQAFAFPKHPWLRLAYDLLCSHWKYVLLDSTARSNMTSSEEVRIGTVDRICQLILCAPDFATIQDPQIFSRAGLSFPPGYGGDISSLEGGLGLPPGIEPGDPRSICNRCLNRFLGEIDVVDGIPIMPPLIKWCWIHRRRCSLWRSIGPTPAAGFSGIGRVTQLAVHPTKGNILIAGAAGGGVWRSDNSGITWRPLMELQPTLTIGAVAFAPSNPNIIYAASGEDADGWNPAWGGIGLYRSTDGGTHWSIATKVSSTRFSAIVVHPTDPDILYLAGDQGLHRSDDGGLSWIANPGQDSLFDATVTDIVIAHDDPDRLYVGVHLDGVYETVTGGIQVGMSPAFTRLDAAGQLPSGGGAGWIKLSIGRSGANGSNCILAKLGPNGSRIFRTQDGGATWPELAANVASVSFDEWCSVVAVDPTDENVIYAGNNIGLQRTTNGGAASADWASASAGVHADQQDLAFDPNSAAVLYLANDGGVYRSIDRGATWEFRSGALAITQMYDIDIAERDRDIAAGGAQDNGVYYRNAAGVWRHIPWGDGTQVAIDQTDPKIFYFSSQNGLPTNIRKSTDGGVTHQQIGQNGLSGGSPWITIIKLDPTDPIVNPSTSRTLFVCGATELFRSTDGGQNWQRVNDGSGNPFSAFGTITALEFAPSDPTILYLGTENGALYRGVNGGSTAADWSRIDLAGTSADMLFPNAQIQSLAVNPHEPDDVWAVFGGSGVNFTNRPNMILNPLGISHLFRSIDAGTTWLDASGQIAPTILPDVPTSAVAVSDFDSEVAYAGNDVGVFRTVDGGQTWTAFQDGLPRSPVTELRLNRRFDRLVAATMGRGAYVRDI
ncbi:hypothetical protein HPT29_026500 (plasmid) [Microvirga terrae]|uniref:Sortilin N-terminal domain-containing protein n=1 Tax=Microvirga terrae TaxID=2740529 RepID=A0ABY5S0Y7_9HYPH|nr:hypothetical protein [Microvirga terrae]UVF22236.1 hypothetical protein HPT29_026500 [Microvirga terrae]